MDKPRDACGLAGVLGHPSASLFVKQMLQVQQHRGEDGAGIVSCDKGQLFEYRDNGLVREVFSERNDGDLLQKLPGSCAIGHVRYRTWGGKNRCNLQPFLISDSRYGPLSIGVNGQLVDVLGVGEVLKEQGAAFQSSSDSEVLAHLLLQSKQKRLEDAVAEMFPRIPTTYSFIVMTPDTVIAGKDKYGVRPLSVGQMAQSDGSPVYLIASETAAFRILADTVMVSSVNPGEMVVFNTQTPDGLKRIQYVDAHEHFCVFESIYFSDPRSEHKGVLHEDFRQLCGIKVYQEHKERLDSIRNSYEDIAIVPLLDSGKQAAIGLAKCMGSDFYKEYFMRRHNAPKGLGRSYTAQGTSERVQRAMMKLDLREEKVLGKAIITVDDSIVRGHSARINNQRLRRAGARYIANVIASPMIHDVCISGMDHQVKEELLGWQCADLDSLAKRVEADVVMYLSLDGLHDLVKQVYGGRVCSGCFGGKYPPAVNNYLYK